MLKFAALLFPALAISQTITLTGPPARSGQPSSITVTLAGTSASAAAVQWFLPVQPGMAAAISPALAALGKTLICQSPAAIFGCILSGGVAAIPDGALAAITLPAPAAAVPLPLTRLLGVNPAGDGPDIQLTSGAAYTLTPLSPCDINGDGKTDLLDIRNIIDQLEGVIPMSSDLSSDGKTSLVDLQRVINAVATGTCRTGA